MPHYYIQSSITAITAFYFQLIASHYFRYYPLLPHLLQHYYLITDSDINAYYFHFITSYYFHYYPLLPHLLLHSYLFCVVMNRLLHNYCLITTFSGTLLPLLLITSTSLLLITTKHVFIITHYSGK
jgi:hypothetical protein